MSHNPNSALISLEQAQQLVTLLEQQDNAAANDLLRSISPLIASDLFSEIGKLTRDLHQSITHFELDPRITALVRDEMPDAAERLSSVIDMTESAANRTMDAVENCFPLVEQTLNHFENLRPGWDRLMSRQLQLGEFKSLCHGVDGFLAQSEADAQQLKSQLNDVLMAQDYQDLTGQMIRRVITLVHEVEYKLVTLLTEFSNAMAQSGVTTGDGLTSVTQGLPAGAKSAKRDDLVSGQDDVDDLLSSLGF